jgi:pSer/pThr/pTyr-binding forkhead associated (FHA) protein
VALETQKTILYELRAQKNSNIIDAPTMRTGRYIIGRSESCDIVVKSPLVSSVHAVIEVTPNGCKVFDMNSRNGILINGKKEIVGSIKVGDKVHIADVELHFELYHEEKSLPPVLETLSPNNSESSVTKKVAPEKIIQKDEESDEIPYIVYPLALDPKADESEYIFEDADELYPIFQYEYAEQAVEVMTLFQDRVYAVDYLSKQDATYKLKGFKPKKSDIELPTLGANETMTFVELKSGNCVVHHLEGFKLYHLEKDELKEKKEATANLQENDIIKLVHQDLEIYLRRVPTPPNVKAPPFFRMENSLKKALAAVLFLIFATLAGFNLFKVDPEMIKQKNPERVAAILYKPKPRTVTIAKPKQEVKKTAKKAVKKKIVKKTTKKNVTEKVKNSPKKVVNKDPGKKTAPKKQITRKSPPKPAPKRKVVGKPKTTRTTQVTKAKTARAVVPKAKGHVDVYKSFNFKSTVSSIVAKGGSFKGANIKAARSTNDLNSANVGGSTTDVKTANVSQDPGSLTGAATGKLASKGAEGLSAKTQIATAGIPSETVVLGSMDPDVIRSILREYLPQFRYCYQRALDASSSDISGVVKMNFIIGASGHVTRASVANSGSRVPTSTRNCMVNVLKGIKFPAPLGGGKVEVNQPFNLYPKRN